MSTRPAAHTAGEPRRHDAAHQRQDDHDDERNIQTREAAVEHASLPQSPRAAERRTHRVQANGCI